MRLILWICVFVLIAGCRPQVDDTKVDELIQRSWSFTGEDRFDILLDAERLARAQNDVEGGLRTSYFLAYYYEDNQDYARADSAYLIALQRSRDSENIAYEISALIGSGQIGIYQRRLDEAEVFLNQALELSKTISDDKMIGYSYFAQALLYDRKSDIQSSIAAYNKAVESFTLSGDTDQQIESLNFLGIQYSTLGLFDLSSTSYLEAASLALQTGDSSQYVSSVYQSGINLIKNKEYNAALSRGKQALFMMAHIPDLAKKARIMNNIGDAYLGLYSDSEEAQYYDSALYYMTESLSIKDSIGDVNGKAYSLLYLGKLHLTAGSVEAIEYLDRAHDLWHEAKDSLNLTKASLMLGNYYLQHDLKKAQKHLLFANESSRNSGDIGTYTESLTQLALLAEKKDDKTAQLGYLIQRDSVRESWSVQEIERVVSATEVRLKTLEAIKSNELLILANKSQAEKAKSRKKFLYIISGLLLISLALIYVLIKSSKKLRVLNLRIKTMTQNAYHSHSNGLALLTSMLRSERESTDRLKEKRLLDGVLTRVDALNGLARQLFNFNSSGEDQDQNLIDTNEYLEDLIQETTFSVLDNMAELTMNIASLKVSPKVALNLGLVLNEMITNSSKYAQLPETHLQLIVTLTKQENGLKIKYADNGPGLVMDEIEKGNHHGIDMIRKLIMRDLKGEVSLSSGNEGLTYIISLKNM